MSFANQYDEEFSFDEVFEFVYCDTTVETNNNFYTIEEIACEVPFFIENKQLTFYSNTDEFLVTDVIYNIEQENHTDYYYYTNEKAQDEKEEYPGEITLSKSQIDSFVNEYYGILE